MGHGENVVEGMKICWPFVLINSLQTQVERTANINTYGCIDLCFVLFFVKKGEALVDVVKKV